MCIWEALGAMLNSPITQKFRDEWKGGRRIRLHSLYLRSKF